MSATSTSSKPSGQWQPPTLEEMQAMLPQYEFVTLLGRGGMGAVYKAMQASLQRPVAIKVLPGDLIDDTDSQFAERFKNEARTMARMNHANIVNVYDFGETQTGLLYIVMEFIDGTDVAQMIATQGRLPEDYALSITAHVCDALNYAHKNGVIHRDIKPANILINMEGAVKVADFGLAKQSDAGQSGLTKTNMAMGTPDFVAPEALIPGMPLDGRADLYAVGVMLYQMLTGEIPRGIWTLPGMKIGTDPRFDGIITKAMQTDREVRYSTAADLRRDLDTILALPRSALIAQQQAAAEASARATQAQKQAASSAQARPPEQAVRKTTPPVKKSSQGLIVSIAAVLALGGGVAYMLRAPSGQTGPQPPDAEAPAPPVSNAPATATPLTSLPVTGWRPLQPETVQADGWGRLTRSIHVPGDPSDVALRARLRFKPNSAGISVRESRYGDSFRAEIAPKGDAVMLHRDSPDAAERRLIARAELSQPLTPGKDYLLAVASVGDTVSVHVDGRPLLSERIPRLVGKAVLWTRGPVEVRDIEWLAFPGSTPPPPSAPTRAAAPAMTPPVAATPAVPLDASQRFSGLSLPRDLTKKDARSSWAFSGGHLVLSDTTFNDLQLLALPLKPGDSYEMELEYAFHADNRGYLKLFLPAPQGWCSLQLHAGHLVCFFDNNRQPHNHGLKPGGETNRLQVKSARSGTAARFTVTLDGKPVTEFTGTGVTEWQYWPDMSPLRGSICLGGETKSGPPITLHSFHLVSAGGTPSAMAAAAVPVAANSPGAGMSAPQSPKAVTSPAPAVGMGASKSANLLTLVDVKRDVLPDAAAAGENVWKHDGGTLAFADLEKPGRIAAPVSLADTDDFEIEVLWQKRRGATPNLSTNESGYISLDIPVAANRWVRVDVAHAGNKVLVAGTRIGFTGPGQVEGMRVIVRCQGKDQFTVTINGSVIGSVTGLREKAQSFDAHPLFKSETLPALYFAPGDHKILEWTVRALNGVVKPLWDPAIANDPRLAQLESGYQARYATDAQKPFETALATLNQSYIANGISKARTAAQAKGALAEVLAFDREKALVEKDGDVPAEDAADMPESLKQLRATYRAARARFVTERDAKVAPLMKIYLKALDDYAAELSKAGKIDEAKQVRTLRDMKAAQEAAPAPAQGAALKDGVRIDMKQAGAIPILAFEAIGIKLAPCRGACHFQHLKFIPVT